MFSASRSRSIRFSRNLTQNVTTSFPEFPQFSNHQEIYDYSIRNPDEFWAKVARTHLSFKKDFTKTSHIDLAKGDIRWFEDGTLNASYNCIDRHLATKKDQVALIWEGDELGDEESITYKNLHALTVKLAVSLRELGIGPGDRVAFYMPSCIVAAAAMQAVVRLGGIHAVVFAGFSAEALRQRINDSGAKVVVTMDSAFRGGKEMEVFLRDTVYQAVADGACPTVTSILVKKRTGVPHNDKKLSPGINEIDLDESLRSAESVPCEAVPMPSEAPLYLMYTSGSTGTPKGLVHTTGGFLCHQSLGMRHAWDIRDGDILGCVADIGWQVGHSMTIYGALVNGGTGFLFESTPVYPDPGRYWRAVERHRFTHFFSAPTAYRMLMQKSTDWIDRYDLSSLRVIATAGEICDRSTWQWLNDVVGKNKVEILDSWWQTETGSPMINPRPSQQGAEIPVGKSARPFYGIEPKIMDGETKRELSGAASGILTIKRPWPAIARTIYGDHERYIKTYFSEFPGQYTSGDGGARDEKGYFSITGRTDDVINISGHRLSTSEIENIISNHPDVSETAVIGADDKLKGHVPVCYVILHIESKSDPDSVRQELFNQVATVIGKWARPGKIVICSNLPKTRSGKIMRRILRKIGNKETDFGDISTLADPGAVSHVLSEFNNQ